MNYPFKLKPVVVFLFLFAIKVEAQKTFSTTITFPSSANMSNISASYYDGLNEVSLKVEANSKKIIIAGLTYSEFPLLTVVNRISNKMVYAAYFLKNNSYVKFINKPGSTNLLDSATLINATNIKDMGESKFDSFAKTETDKLISFIEANGYDLTESDSLENVFIKLDNEIRKKKLTFIKNNNSLYYSIWTFLRDFVSNTDFTADSLLNIYNTYFSKQYSKTFEGRECEKILFGRLNTNTGKIAPDFAAHDIYGKLVSLKDLRGKYILLNFWASWCGPCIAEMPAISAIKKLYPQGQIEIISVSYDSDSSKCLKAIDKYQLDWINIMSNKNVINIYGNNPAIPQVYLIDPTGTIIYSRTDSKDYTLGLLSDLIKTKL